MSRPQEEAENVAENGPSAFAVSAQSESVQKCQIFQDFPKFWGNPGQSISLQKWPLPIANRGSKLAKCWAMSRPQEETKNDAGNGPSAVVVSVRNEFCADRSNFPGFSNI